MRLFFTLLTAFFLSQPIFGAGKAFVMQDVDSEQIVIKEGDFSIRLSPYCTFNILLSLAGFDSGILTDAYNPEWPFKEEYRREILSWNDSFQEKWAVSHHPMNWMKNSCIWFSQRLAEKLGIESLTDYVGIGDYGNQDFQGDEGKGNGLRHAWIGSSLRISPLEQVNFITRMLRQELPISYRATDLTREILYLEELSNGMTLYGKTSAGSHGKGRDSTYKVGWFVGWVEIESRRFSFAYLVHGTEPGDFFSNNSPKEQLKERLLQLNWNEYLCAKVSG